MSEMRKHGAELRFLQSDRAVRHQDGRFLHRWFGRLPHNAKDKKSGNLIRHQLLFRCEIWFLSDDPIPPDPKDISRVTLIVQARAKGGRRYFDHYTTSDATALTQAQTQAIRWAKRNFYVEN
jgi:hypothetical protein